VFSVLGIAGEQPCVCRVQRVGIEMGATPVSTIARVSHCIGTTRAMQRLTVERPLAVNVLENLGGCPVDEHVALHRSLAP
jgi:hypothetical protein